MNQYGPDQRLVDELRAAGFSDKDAYGLAQAGISVPDALAKQRLDKIVEDQKIVVDEQMAAMRKAAPPPSSTPYVRPESFLKRLAWLIKWTLIFTAIGAIGIYVLPLWFGTANR